MKALVRVMVLVVLAIPSSRAEGLPMREQVAEGVTEAKRSELEKMRAVEAYYRKIGKIASADYYRAKADKLEPAKRIYVRVKSNAVSRRKVLQLEELITKSIVKVTPHKIVDSVEDADMILELELRPVGRSDR